MKVLNNKKKDIRKVVGQFVTPVGKVACCFVWVWNLVADIAGGKEAEGVSEHGVEENIWT